jgi:phage/plasmid-associated DNA primase
MKDAFLVVLNELSLREYMQNESQYKELVTDSSLNINCKFKDAGKINSFHRAMGCSNKDDPIKADGSRRNLIIRCSDEKIGDIAYFDHLYSLLDNMEVLRTLYDYLMNIPDLDKFKQLKKPMTNHQLELQKLDRSAPEQFLYDIVDKNQNQNELKFTNDNLFTLFQEWKDDNHVEYDTSKVKFGMKLAVLKLDGLSSTKSHDTTYKVLNIKKLMKAFRITPNKEKYFEEKA